MREDHVGGRNNGRSIEVLGTEIVVEFQSGTIGGEGTAAGTVITQAQRAGLHIHRITIVVMAIHGSDTRTSRFDKGALVVED